MHVLEARERKRAVNKQYFSTHLTRTETKQERKARKSSRSDVAATMLKAILFMATKVAPRKQRQ
jgi:hypothetical protein